MLTCNKETEGTLFWWPAWLTRAVVFMLWTLDLWEVVSSFLEAILVNKGNAAWGYWGKSCRATWPSRNSVLTLWGAGEQALRALDQCLQGTLAAALTLPELCIWGLLWGLVSFGMFLNEFE